MAGLRQDRHRQHRQQRPEGIFGKGLRRVIYRRRTGQRPCNSSSCFSPKTANATIDPPTEPLPEIKEIACGLVQWLEGHGYHSLAQARRSMNLSHCPDPSVYERANYLRVLGSRRSTVPPR